MSCAGELEGQVLDLCRVGNENGNSTVTAWQIKGLLYRRNLKCLFWLKRQGRHREKQPFKVHLGDLVKQWMR